MMPRDGMMGIFLQGTHIYNPQSVVEAMLEGEYHSLL